MRSINAKNTRTYLLVFAHRVVRNGMVIVVGLLSTRGHGLLVPSAQCDGFDRTQCVSGERKEAAGSSLFSYGGAPSRFVCTEKRALVQYERAPAA